MATDDKRDKLTELRIAEDQLRIVTFRLKLIFDEMGEIAVESRYCAELHSIIEDNNEALRAAQVINLSVLKDNTQMIGDKHKRMIDLAERGLALNREKAMLLESHDNLNETITILLKEVLGVN